MAERSAVSIMRILSGTAGGQLVSLLASLVIARLFAPESFGAFAAISSLASVLGTVGGLRLEAAIPLPKSDETARQLLGACLSITLASGVAVTLLLLFTGPYIASVLGLPQGAQQALWLAPLAIVLTAAFTAYNQFTLRNRRYGLVALRALATAIATALIQVSGGLLYPSPVTLMAGVIIGQFTGLVVLARGGEIRLTSLKISLSLLREYKDFPLILAPTTLVNTLGLQLPLLLGTALYGGAFAGWFGMTQRIIAAPITLLGQSIGQYALGEFGSLVRSQQSLEAGFWKASRYLAASALVVGLGLWLLAPPLITALLGNAYTESGTYARMLSVGIAFQILASPLSSLLILVRRQMWQAGWDGARLILTGGLIVACWGAGVEPISMLVALSVLQAVLYIGLWFIILAAIRGWSVSQGE